MNTHADTPERLPLTSQDIAAFNRERLKELFPAVFTETLNEQGELVASIDFERLKAELGSFSDVFEARRERYGMDWPGKKDGLKIIQQPSIGTLTPCRDESVDFDTTQNLFIEGDNLEALKLLQKSYFGQVKMIYIDPPYNTGKEFIYPDKYSETLETYLAYAGLINDEGKKFESNPKNEGRFHTKWLNMMYPRLYLAKNLLREDGLIFISIDDNEVHNLRFLMNEVFGEENFIDQIIWKKRYGGGAKEKFLVTLHEYILIYSRSVDSLDEIFIPLEKESIDRYYKFKDQNFEKRGPYRTHPLEATKSMGDRKNLIFPITGPSDVEIWPKRQWLWSPERVKLALSKGELEFIKSKDGNWSVHSKQYLKNENGDIRKAKAFSVIDDIYSQHGTNEIIEIFGDAQFFSFPKPSELLRKLISISTDSKNNDIVLDLFAGSASTAHAVMRTNEADLGNRTFIMVQLPEHCEEGSIPEKNGYSTIADIGKERIRRVIAQIQQEQAAKAAEAAEMLPGMAEEIHEPDLGFRVFKLNQSTFRLWDGVDRQIALDELLNQLEEHVEHINPDVSQEDILFEILLKAGFKLTELIEQSEMASKVVYSVAEGALLICLEDEITVELITAVAEAEPIQFICLDRGFQGNDQLKANAVQTFASRNQGRDKDHQIIFRTV